MNAKTIFMFLAAIFVHFPADTVHAAAVNQLCEQDSDCGWGSYCDNVMNYPAMCVSCYCMESYNLEKDCRDYCPTEYDQLKMEAEAHDKTTIAQLVTEEPIEFASSAESKSGFGLAKISAIVVSVIVATCLIGAATLKIYRQFKTPEPSE